MDSKYKKLESGQNSTYRDKISTEDLVSSSQPFLADSKEDTNPDFDDDPHYHRRRSYTRAIVAHGLIFLTYSLAVLGAVSLFGHRFGLSQQLTYTPAQEAVEYQRVFYDGSIDKKSIYIGNPRPELEEAWHNLTKHISIKLTKDELKKLNLSALELADGSGYHGQLNVYHHLHCLKFLRQAFYSDDYERPSKQHIDHCVDDIRQALMCHPDTSISTLNWEEGVRRPMPYFKLYHTCVNWDKLDDWAGQRSFSMFDQKSLVNPKYGLAFPLINGSIEYTPPGPDMHIVWPEDN